MVESNMNLMVLSKSILLRLNLFNFAKKTYFYRNMVNKYNEEAGNNNFFNSAIRNINKFHIPSLNLSKGEQIKDLFNVLDIEIPDEGFIFSIDRFKTLNHVDSLIGNISIDYSKILNSSLNELCSKYENKHDDFSIDQKNTLDALNILIDRIIDALETSNREDKDKFINFFHNIKTNPVSTFEEALQRILFFNQVLWQTGHRLNGFGRLDLILDEIYSNDSISKEEALYLIKDFLKAGNSYFYYKSSTLAGDTGQIIVLGGLNKNNGYFSNDLTYLFIRAVNELHLPDPKIILRYANNVPRSLIESSVNCMATGVGSPLLSNDEIIIPKLIDFGYEDDDAYNYVVSACWEPAPIGRGLELNNVASIVYLIPLNDLLDNEDLDQFKNFDVFFRKYKEYLTNYILKILDGINTIKWERDPLISLFIENKFDKDVSQGSAIYNNYGLTSVSLSNTVNSLYNIKNLVFDGKYSLSDLNDARINNFENISLKNILKSQKKFGMDDEEIIALANEITECVNDVFATKTTRYGGKFKFGLSSPEYIGDSVNVKASLDGRCDFEPFDVHISLEDNKDYTELMHFASKLGYGGNRFNGNVVDFMVSPDFIKNNFDKFVDFIELSLNMGVFQMQLNVVSSDTLIDAQKYPDKYPNLIVRVWGFSSYFNDLPLEYQNVLIKRALENEGKSN
jgi:formate C-acetyltransferase